MICNGVYRIQELCREKKSHKNIFSFLQYLIDYKIYEKKRATATKNNLLVVKLTNFYSNCNIPGGERQQQNMHTDTYFNGYINGQSFWSWLTIQFDDQHMFHTNYNAMHSFHRPATIFANRY